MLATLLQNPPVRTGLTLSWVIPAVVIAVPILAIAVFSLRLLLLLLVPVALVWLAGNARAVRAWLGLQVPMLHHDGVRLATDVWLHPTHAWARPEPDRTLRVGADDLIATALGPPDRVTMPDQGQAIGEGETLFVLHRGTRTLKVRAPATGHVVERNEELAAAPSGLHEDPYGRGWVVRLKAPDRGAARRPLRRGRAARAWFATEVDRFLDAAFAEPPAVATARDGGEVVADFHELLEDGRFAQLKQRFFGDDGR